MQHRIKPENSGIRAEEMLQAVQACVHCGFCLAACPTYKQRGEEMNSPRGRIFLMKEVLEEGLQMDEARPYIDNCLGCMACEPACPSGVLYGELLTGYRFLQEKRLDRSGASGIIKKLLAHTLPYPRRLRFALKSATLALPIRNLLPDSFQPLLNMLPESLPKKERLPELSPAKGKRKGRVALISGCAQSVLAPSINTTTISVLNKCGFDVVVPSRQGCCGSILMHGGDEKGAQKLAGKNLTAFPKDVDAIITNAAGCGSGIKEYSYLFKGHPLAEPAKAFAKKTMDICEFLAATDIRIDALPSSARYAYQDACHLKNAQGISTQPRGLLQSISNLTLVELADGGLCCGSAGTYNLEQPEDASRLGKAKVEAILSSDVEGVISGNIGCITQIRQHLGSRDLPVFHTIEVLDRACN
ncbi:MAG: (Fe-S)-binding protein [Calditrichia bacterium]